ncbi:YhdP family protein [Undibacterium sp. Di26W]|uniref:YhdP family protein n=1 Tax=Undibacterium sp. Di26W TaxID=3413035 RepID=UPI003BEFBFCB
MTQAEQANIANPAKTEEIPPPPSRFWWFCGYTWRTCGRGLRFTLKFLLLLYFLFCALVLVLRYVVLPNVNSYKPDIEKMISASLGRQLQIANLHASWQGLNPQLVLDNVVLHDAKGMPALSLPQVSATLSWWTLAVADLRFERVVIEKPALDVTREADGKFFVGGFLIDPAAESKGQGMDWVLSQREIVIRNGSVRWTDKLRNAPELTLPDVSFVLQSQWRHHRFALKATPPASLSAPLDIRGDFQHPVFAKKIADFSLWSGELYTDLRHADLPALKAYVDYPADVKKGYGSVRSWLHLEKGRVADLTADLSLTDVVGKFRADLPELDMALVSGRLVASEHQALKAKYLSSVFGQSGHSISLIDFSMRTRNGEQLPPTSIKETFTPGEKGQPEKVELYVKTLDLQTLANFAEHLPLPADQRQMLVDFAPKGQLRDFTAKWQGSYPDVASYSIKGQFINLSMQAQPAQLARTRTAQLPAKAAVPAIPGFENLSGHIEANDKGGNFTLDSKDLSLRLSSYFVDPLMPFSRLLMQAQWQFVAQDKLIFQINKMDAQQEGMHAVLSGKHIMSMRHGADAQPGEVDLTGNISGFDLKQLDRYIPTVAPDHLRHWLLNSILDGRADDVTIRIKGDLAHFPFIGTDGKRAHKGEFIVKGNLTGGKLDFTAGALTEDGHPLWPVIEDIKGNFIFDKARMEINGDTARTLGVDLKKVKAVIPDLAHHNGILNIDGTVNGSLQNMLGYVGASPVSGWLGHFLKETKTTAPAALSLKLQLPLQHLIESKVQGVLNFANNDVALQPNIPMVSGLNGRLEFNETGVNLGTLKGNLLGSGVQITGGSQKDNSVKVRLDGSMTAEGLRKVMPPSMADRIGERINGSARYTASIHVKKRQPEIVIESNLSGLALNFPLPLKKSAMEAMPLRFEMLPLASNDAQVWRDDIRVSLGNTVNARYLRQKTGSAPWQVLRGGIGVNAPAPEPDSGLSANIELKSLNIDEWRRLAVPAASSNSSSNNSNSGSSAQAANAGQNTVLEKENMELDLSPYLEPTSMAARTPELHIMGKQLENVVVGVTHQKNVWQANIHSNQAAGYLTWNEGPGGQGVGSVTARLSNLIIPQSAAADVSELLEGKNTTTQIPGLDIVAENFELFNKKLGYLELQAVNQAQGNSGQAQSNSGREWQINKVLLKNPDAEFSGNGKWSSQGGDGRTQLNYVLDVANAGKLLERLGFVDVLRGGRGKLEGDVHWNGLPFAMDIPSMNGQIKLVLSSGQFLKVDPGAAKLLGVLSMQSLPRRLTLDFRDVFSDGFAFDSIAGMAQIQQGVAKTDNLKMLGVSATVLLQGNADIVHESQNLHATVIPVVNVGTASVVYGLAVNPVIGLGTFLAQLFLREPLSKAFTFEYQISGSWKEPTVTKMDNRDEAKNNRKPVAAQ